MDWDERHSKPGFTYGTAPNEFLASVAGRIPQGEVLSLAEREGSNTAYWASLRYRTAEVDGAIRSA